MLGIRLDAETEQGLQQLAARSRRSKSEIAREAIRRYVRQHDASLGAEARRQSLRATERGWTSEDEAWADLAVDDGPA